MVAHAHALPLTPSTRDRMLKEARRQFAERGFYGVSIAQVAAELQMTKQALLHHFGSKERLYGTILGHIAEELAEMKTAIDPSADPASQLQDYFAAMIADTAQKVERLRLLMREILDNDVRADGAGIWYLKPFLEELIAMLRRVPGWSGASDAQLLATVIQLLGAVNYHAVSGPTFRGIFKATAIDAMNDAFAKQLRNMIDATLAAG